ncbi:hypothetical protein G7046_g6382 [Stylonectria norvegica]|nr:hypothetical protein G7046_g6382 [Stylonectria norvegica]
MRSSSSFFALPASILALLSQTSAEAIYPTAIKKLSLDSSEKLFPEHLAFASLPILSPREAAAAAILFLDEQDDDLGQLNGTTRFYRPAFASHYDESEEGMLRRAAQALTLLQRRQALRLDTLLVVLTGRLAEGESGTVPRMLRAVHQILVVGAASRGTSAKALACFRYKLYDGRRELRGSPSTVIVTIIVTKTPSAEPTTQTTTQVITASESETSSTVESASSTEAATSTEIVTSGATGGAPFRPIKSSTETSPPDTTETSDTQTGCPTGFYGCLATHGGGCCRTDRDCNTYSCPNPSTTIISDGATVVVLATDVPTTRATSTCAGGWFLCGSAAGPVAGCCPSGYDCGTASCFTVQASETAKVQKEFPEKKSSAGTRAPWTMLGAVVGGLSLIVLV